MREAARQPVDPADDADAIRFTVNGVPAVVQGPPMRRLSEVLRSDLGLTGTKVGCDAGDCGACTVLMDGRQVCSCLTAVGQAAGRRVETVEGLAEGGALNRLQTAFHRFGAAQCGICTPGMLMAATDLLARAVTPSRGEVEDALGGVLCRCTGYRKIVDAVLHAADPALALLPMPEVGAAVGARLAKTDGIPKLTGAERFGADTAPADALWLRVVRSPHRRARFVVGDLSPLTQDWPGLVRVLSADDIPFNRYGIYPTLKDQPALAEGEVRYRGEAVLALIGDRTTIETLPDETLPITWEALEPVTFEAAIAGGAPALHADVPDNVLVRGRVERGAVEEAFESAAATAAIAIETAFVEHAYIEPEAGYARRLGDRIEIVACTQTPYMDRDEIANILKLDRDQVRIIPTAVGGGFGGKLDLSLQPLIATAAWLLNRPVRCTYTRPESLASSTKRHPARIRARAAAAGDGSLLAYDFFGDYDTGAYASWGPTVANRVPVHAAGPYHVPHVRALTRALYTNGPPSGAFRGFGVPQAAIAHEALMDALAARLGLDPLEFRLTNALRAGQSTATGQVLAASCGLAQCLEGLRPHWTAARVAAEVANRDATGPIRRGVGVGCMWYGIGNTSLSNPSAMRVGLKPDGRLTLYNGAVDIGQGSNTIMVQICADALGASADRFDLVVGDTDLTEDAGKTSASRQTFVSGKAAQLAGQALRSEILKRLNVGEDAALKFENGMVAAVDAAGERSLDLSTLEADGRGDVLSGLGSFDPPTTPLDGDGQGTPYATYGFAAQMAEVAVDVDLGTVKVTRIVAAHDVGRAVNPTQVEGQIHGGIAQGIGLALMEDYVPGRTENLHDYLIPTFGDVPDIECLLVEDAEPLGPYGAKGIGEPALVPTAPAILNAIHHATGARITRVPATPDRVRAAILALGDQS